jgi:hypothetical protein
MQTLPLASRCLAARGASQCTVTLPPHLSAQLRSIDKGLSPVPKISDGAIEFCYLANFFGCGEFVPKRTWPLRYHMKISLRVRRNIIPAVSINSRSTG